MNWGRAGRVLILVAFIFSLSALAETDQATPVKKKKKKHDKTTETVVEKKAPAPPPVVTEPYDYNARLNPFNVFFGRIDANLDVRLSERFSVGPTLGVSFLTVSPTSYVGFAFGLRGNVYLTGNAISSSFYVGPSLIYDIWTTSGTINAGNFGNFHYGSCCWLPVDIGQWS
jgi:hypothetical protein